MKRSFSGCIQLRQMNTIKHVSINVAASSKLRWPPPALRGVVRGLGATGDPVDRVG